MAKTPPRNSLHPDSGKVLLGTWVEDELKDPDNLKKSRAKKGDDFFIDRELCKSGHMHIRGRTGSGKTSRAIMPLVESLLRPYQLAWETIAGEKKTATERDALMIFDFGGDKALLNHARDIAKNEKRKFRFLTLDPNKSHRFDPMQSVTDDENRIISITNLLLRAFSLDHGLIYGGSYYSSRNLQMLLAVCEEMIGKRKGGKNLGLRDIDRYLRDPKNDVKDSEHVRSIFKGLLFYPQLEVSKNDPEAIDMRRAIKNREVIYFFCPTIAEGATSRQIGGLGLYNAIHAAMTLSEDGDQSGDERPLPHTHIFCDEFQEIAGTSFEALLSQSRKFGISLYLANQTTEQLIKKDIDLAASVRDNTKTKMYFTVTGKRDIDEFLTFSKERLDVLRSKQEDGRVFALGAGAEGRASESEYITTVLKKNQILECSATDGDFFVLCDDGKGHRESRRLHREHMMEPSHYRKLKYDPIPDTLPVTTSASDQQESSYPPWLLSHLSETKSPAHSNRIKQLQAVLTEVQREEKMQL